MESKMEYPVKKVFVVADNIISSLGFTTQENIEAIFGNRTGIQLLEDKTIYPEPFQAGLIDRKRFEDKCKENNLELFPTFESLVILSITDALRKSNIDISNSNTLLILSTTKGNIEYLSTLNKEDLENKEPRNVEQALLWKSAQNIANYFKLKTEPVVISNACVSGVSAVETAAKFLRAGLYENVIVTGADLITSFTVSGFQSFKSISPNPCKPYDITRDGLSIGEGAGTIVLTNNKKNADNKHPIYILGGATANDANHISGPSRTGDGLHYAIENAIKQSGIKKSDIDFMNLHGTATVFNDEMESKAVNLSILSNIPTNSYKGYLGHTLGASGVIEIIICIESLRKNTLFSTKGFSELGVPEKMNIITQNIPKEIHTFLKTASGFGGFNSAIVISDKFSFVQPNVNDVRTHIISNCQIHNHKIIVDEKCVYEGNESDNLEVFLKSAFKNLDTPNMKFYKMDNLCKLGYVAVQYLLKDNSTVLKKYNSNDIALVLNNSFSSLDTDINHQLTIIDDNNYFLSPAIFVYTLPNIVIGEVCIKEKIQGKTTFFISSKYNQPFLSQYLDILFQTTHVKIAIIGWLDCLGKKHTTNIYLIEKL